MGQILLKKEVGQEMKKQGLERLKEEETEMIRLDAALKTDETMVLSQRLTRYRREAEILSAQPEESILRTVCHADPERPVEAVLAELNEVNLSTMRQALTASKLLPELLVLVDKGLSIADAAILAQLDANTQQRIGETTRGADRTENGFRAELQKLDRRLVAFEPQRGQNP